MNNEFIILIILFLLFGLLVFGYNIYQLVKNTDRNLKETMKAYNQNFKTLDEKHDETINEIGNLKSKIQETQRIIVDDDYKKFRKDNFKDD
jgi:hypothetical protein